MNVVAKLDEIQSMTLQVFKKTKLHRQTDRLTDGWLFGQRENSLPNIDLDMKYIMNI